MDHKKYYEKFEIQVVVFSTQDVVTASDAYEQYDNGLNDLIWLRGSVQ